MKTLKTIALVLLLLNIAGCMCRGWLFRQIVIYHAIASRPTYSATDPALIGYIDSTAILTSDADVDDIITESQHLTSRYLDFTFERNENDPNRLIHTHTANCIGYAAFFTATCNYLLQKRHLSDQWMAKPQVAQIYMFHQNVHLYIDDPFFKDHDFAVVQNKTTGAVIAVDPSLHDYLLIDRIRSN